MVPLIRIRLHSTGRSPIVMLHSTTTSSTRDGDDAARNRRNSVSNAIGSVANGILRNDPPPGFFAATAQATSTTPNLRDIRTGLYGADGWHEREQSSSGDDEAISTVTSAAKEHANGVGSTAETLRKEQVRGSHASEVPGSGVGRGMFPRTGDGSEGKSAATQHSDHDALSPPRRVYTSGYIPPPQLPWTTPIGIALKGFWKWVTTPFGFLVTLYGLNVVAWGGMLFLLLCNASKYMCWVRGEPRTRLWDYSVDAASRHLCPDLPIKGGSRLLPPWDFQARTISIATTSTARDECGLKSTVRF